MTTIGDRISQMSPGTACDADTMECPRADDRARGEGLRDGAPGAPLCRPRRMPPRRIASERAEKRSQEKRGEWR